MRRTRSAMRHFGYTESEAAWVRADRERASRWFAWFAIAFLVAALLPHVWRAF